MMTALNIEEHTGGSALRLFHRNRIRVEHRYCDDAAVKSVCYEHYRGRVNWQLLDRFVRSERRQVLCGTGVELPEESGFRRYVSYELSRRMCGNAALYLLRTCGMRGLKAVLADRNGEHIGLCESMAVYVDPVYVLTEADELYAAQAAYLLSERGAALRVSRNPGILRDADLIICPDRIDMPLECAPGAVILSGEKPAVGQNAPVIYDYFFEPAEKFRRLMPPYLDEMYFAAALYGLAGVRELGAELFTRCGDGITIHTRASLAEALKKRG